MNKRTMKYGISYFYSVWIVALLMVLHKTNGLASVDCKPREVILETRAFHKHGNRATPQHIAIHRCSGGSEEVPEAYRCVATKTSDVIIKLNSVPSPYYTIPEDARITLKNHTQCKMKCVCERLEKCPGPAFEATCDYGLIWDKATCECKTQCAITGRTNKPNGDEEKSISLTIFIIVLIAEFVIVALVTFFVIDALKCKKHSKGVIHRTAIYVRSLSTSEKDSCKIPTLKRNRTDTGSVSFLHDVNQDGNSNYRNNNLPITNI